MEIPPIQRKAMELAREHQRHLLISGGALGRLEEIACWFSARQGRELPEPLQAAVVIFAADHGVAEMADFANPEVSTEDLLRHAASGDGAIDMLIQKENISLKLVDVGLKADVSDVAGIEHAVVRKGCGNITRSSAMSQEEYWEAVGIGEDMANQAAADGANLLVAGDMGIGNVVASAAIICELTGLTPDEVLAPCGQSKQNIHSHELVAVEEALARAQGTPSHDILRELGGLEIAAMAGFYRGAAQLGAPILLDGFASAAAALAATAWDVHIAGWMLASHLSDKAGHRQALDELGLEPLINLHLSQGEGIGAALMIPLLQSALALHRGLATV
jgi:nicotinate-nucleotide--dimethylbenzimidazole phosphoribosyltransferase